MKLSEWLSQRDSHTAYDEHVLKQLRDDFGIDVAVDRTSPLAVIRGEATNAHIRGYTGKQFVKAASKKLKDPKGPSFAEPGAEDAHILFGGWQLAGALSYALTGKYPTSVGRGTAFREALRNLQEAGL